MKKYINKETLIAFILGGIVWSIFEFFTYLIRLAWLYYKGVLVLPIT